MSAAKLKSTLTANRDEQNGVVFYQITDPQSGKSFRLYEVEYLIARMLDGKTPNDVLVEKVHRDLQFELSVADFGKFITELHDLGFLEEEVFEPDVALEEVVLEPMDAESMGPPLEHELERLVRSGVLHIKQGLVSQARDYFLAARKCSPEDGRVATMLNHLDVVGDDDASADLEYLWKQALQLYPELCAELGPPGSGISPIPVDESGRREGVLAHAQKRRGLILGLLAAGVVLGLGFHYLWPLLAAPPPLVETERVRAQKVLLFFEAQVGKVEPRRQWDLNFDKAGTVAEVEVKPGDSVKKGQVLARLQLKPAQEKGLKAIRDRKTKTEKAALATSLEVERLLGQLTDKQAEAQSLKDKLDDLQKSFLLKTTTPQSRLQMKKDILAAKKLSMSADRELAKLRAHTAVPQRNKQKLEALQKSAAQSEEKFELAQEGLFIFAPDEGIVLRTDLRPGAKLKEHEGELVLADTTALRVHWKTSDPRLGKLQKGATVRVVFTDGTQIDAPLDSVGQDLVVEVPDPDHKLASLDVKSMRLLREEIEALVVGATAKRGNDDGLVVEDGEVFHRKVEWVEVRGKDAIARSGLRAGDVMVTGPEDLLGKLKDHDKVRLPENLP